jgi:excisionase family DNA binding protein
MARLDWELYDLIMFDIVFKGFKQSKTVRIDTENSSHPDENQPLALLNAREAAAYLRVSLSTLNRMEKCGQLRALRTPGGHRRYTLALLNRCLGTQNSEEVENSPDV